MNPVIRGSRLAIVVCALAATVIPAAQQAPSTPPANARPANPTLDRYKQDVGQEVDGLQEMIQRMNDQVFSFGELGFQEFETTKYLTGILKQNGFTIQENLAGIPTAWMASWGSGKPVIALGSDIDDIPQASQKPGVAYHDPIIEGAPGHGEGHNSGMPLQIAAALAVKKVMEQQHLSGTLRLWPGVAEELDGAKAYYVKAGAFKDVDISIFAHVGSNMQANWGESMSNALVSVEYNFKGESAHAAGAPWRGRSALDAVELMDTAWNFRREHLRLQQRSHYVITNGGDQPNVVPPNASVWYYFRETDYPHTKEMWAIGDKLAQAATMMTDTEVSSRLLGSAWSGHFNKTIAETMHANIETVGLPHWTEADQALAKALQHELKVPEIGLATKLGAAARAVRSSGRGEARRRLGRHRRHLVGRPDGDAQLSGQHAGRSGPQLGERDLDGDADRAQRYLLRIEGRGADRAGLPDAPGAGRAGVGLLQQRPDEEHEVRVVHPAG